MTDILPPAGWPNVRQLETNEFATGGANGNMNEQAKSLAARSELLKKYAALPYESKTDGYALNERVQLATGDIVRSTIPSNVNNPNENMTGWVKVNAASQIFDESGLSQQGVNNGVESISDLMNIPNPKNGSRVYVKSHHEGLNRGGRFVTYDSSKAATNDGIFIFNGWVSEHIVNLTFDHAGAKPNESNFDNTEIINKTLALGLDIYGNADDVYYISGKLFGKGQNLIGGFKINSSRKVRTEHTKVIGGVSTSSNILQNQDSIKMIFIQKSVDLVEFYKIKALGINTILHYGELSDGDTFDQLLDNALTAGLRVILGTENISSDINAVAQWVESVNEHPAVFGYSMFDEPVGRKIYTSIQQAKVNAIRGVTDKPLTVTEYYVAQMYTEFLIKDYDIIFCHNYAYKYSTGTLSERVEKDCKAARRYYGFYKRYFKGKKVIPVCGLFKSDGSDGFSTDEPQILSFAKIYASNTEDNIGFFTWDGLVDNVAISTSFQGLLKALVKKNNQSNTTKSLLFGQIGTDSIDFGTSDLIGLPLVNALESTDLPTNTNGYVGRLHSGSVDGLFTTVVPNAVYAGICFKTQSAIFYSNFTVSNYCTVKLDGFDINYGFDDCTVNFYLSNDLGITKTLCSSVKSSYIEVSFANPFNEDAILIIEVTSTTGASEFFHRFLRGALISTNW